MGLRILLIDSQEMIAEALAGSLLEMMPTVDDVEVVTAIDRVVLVYRQSRPDVVLLGLRLLDRDGLVVLDDLMQEDSTACVVVLTRGTNVPVARRALRGGARGILLWNDRLSDLSIAVGRVSRGLRHISPAIKQQIAETTLGGGEALSFTPREIQVLERLAVGLTVAEAAEQLGISAHTAWSHRRQALAKINGKEPDWGGGSSTAHLVAYAWRRGLVDEESVARLSGQRASPSDP